MIMNNIINNYSCYQLIFQQQYDFIATARQLELVIQRIPELIFLLYSKERVYAMLLIEAKYKELFNTINTLTLQEYPTDDIMLSINNKHIYAVMKFKQHYAIPFVLQPEHFPFYKILADYTYKHTNSNISNSNSISMSISSSIPLLFTMHIKQHNERVSIASYLRKHDLKRTSLFYAYSEHMRFKLQQTHYHSTLIVAGDDREILLKGLTAFKTQYFTYRIKSNKNYRNNNNKELYNSRLYKDIFNRPKKPLFNNNRYTVLSHTEVVSLMLPDSLMLRLTIDGVRPYTTGKML
ncbi:hypothetical protein [Candidatus Nitrosocaldus islandicus]|uniref:hypothetical protein n=1 Tax=Candidatus Nitrosocaldus islandicus TaxID=2045011 RepID=UPI001315983A|nr:hypothetical protein [Candidatus Nitrosocaldus islandicus]